MKSREDIIDKQLRVIQRALNYVWQNGYQHGCHDGYVNGINSPEIKRKIENAVMDEQAKHIELPESCDACPFYQEESSDGTHFNSRLCKKVDQIMIDEPELIPEWCPLGAKTNPCILCDMTDIEKAACCGCEDRLEWEKSHQKYAR